jgi:hypothetical protein
MGADEEEYRGRVEEERRRRRLNRCRYLQRHVPKPWHQIAYEIRLHQIAWDCMPKPLHQIACEDEAFHAHRRAAITIVYRFMCVNAWSTAGATRGGTSPRKERRFGCKRAGPLEGFGQEARCLRCEVRHMCLPVTKSNVQCHADGFK